MKRRAQLFSKVAIAAIAAGAAWLGGSQSAHANPMDIAPERLATCANPAAGCGTEGNYLRADNAAWGKLIASYGMAIAPSAMHPARTTGYGGFEMSLFGTITTVANGEDYMKKGTEGAINGGKFPTSNGTPDGTLQVYGVTARKGLPYGFEIQGNVGYMANTELTMLGGGIRFAPLEGFRTGALGVLPDISVGGYVNTLTGTNKVKLTVPALDVQVSKPFSIANQLIFQPYIGWQMLWIDGDSGVVDGTPAVDGLKNCNARPPTDKEIAAGDDGGFRCQSGGAGSPLGPPDAKANAAKLDMNNNMVFNRVRLRRQRLFIGLAFRYEIAHILLHAMTELADPSAGADGDTEKARFSSMAKQWTFGMMTGVSW